MILESIDTANLGYPTIKQMRQEAITLRNLAKSAALRHWLDLFIIECKDKLPSHECWLEGGNEEYLVIESIEDGWKHILVHIEFEIEDEDIGEKEPIAFATCKRYELKDQKEPDSYNQAPPGLFARYPYLYKVRISHETYLELTKLNLSRLIRKRKEKENGEGKKWPAI